MDENRQRVRGSLGETMSPLFPLFLKLAARRVVVVGGGPVAAAKLVRLVDSGARITLVAERVQAEIERPGIDIVRRAFEPMRTVGLDMVHLLFLLVHIQHTNTQLSG